MNHQLTVNKGATSTAERLNEFQEKSVSQASKSKNGFFVFITVLEIAGCLNNQSLIKESNPPIAK